MVCSAWLGQPVGGHGERPWSRWSGFTNISLESVQAVAPISSCSASDFRLLTFDLSCTTHNFKSIARR